MFPSFIVVLVLMGFVGLVPASAAGKLDAAAINDAAYPSKLPGGERADPAIIKLEVLLDRARFSPGAIDGKLGENAKKALKAFAQARGLGTEKAFSPEVWDELTSQSAGPVIVEYTISNADTEGPFLRRLPGRMERMKNLQALSYTSPQEELAEKFHMSGGLLAALNPGKQFNRPGEVILVANVVLQPTPVEIARVEVDKSEQSVSVFDRAGKLVAFFPATVGSEEKPAPSGTLKVISSDANPTYRYNPEYKFKGIKTNRPFTIRPGPNNPVGVYWIGLSAQGYGIHGTPDPDKIGKTASHGCVRLTNWDARLLGKSIKRGTPVAFVDGSTEPQRSAGPS
jgi:lipoprotein-anchoring transpeptidase ErfK/SrfK